MIRAGRVAAAGLLAGCLTAGLAGCTVSATDLPLPSGSIEGTTYHLNAVFSDALNLPDGAHVKLNGDGIGRVRTIVAKDFTARVGMEVREDVRLPVGTTAELRQATPLGEVFVALHPPEQATPSTPRLRDGDTLGLPDTAAAASVEDLLAALSTLVNGGGLAQIQTIVHELNTALEGRSGDTAHLLAQSRRTLDTLDERTADIDRVLAASKRLAVTLRERSGSIDAAFADLTPGIGELADRTDDLVDALREAGDVSDTGDHLVDRSGRDVRSLLRDIGPVLDGFADTKPLLGQSLRDIVAFGKTVELITKGESAAVNGELSLFPLIVLPQAGDPLPGPGDFADGGRSFAQHLEHQLRSLGGTR